MNARITIKNKKIKSQEIIGDIYAESSPNLKSFICPKFLNSNLIDDFVCLFYICSRSKGVSYFKGLQELQQKESKRLTISAQILNQIGIKTKTTKDSIKIWGNQNLNIKANKTYNINSRWDHRVAATYTIAALTSGSHFKISNGECIATSFPSFFKIIKSLGAKIKIEK